MAWTKEYPSEEFVTVASFWLDKTEVTTRDFRSHVRAGKDLVCDEYATWGTREKEDHPMNCVNHFQAAAYCAFVDKRLPTLAEWEWAARGGRRGSKYPWGDAEPSDQLCWKRGFFATTGEGEGTCPVGSFPAGNTPEGIADLMGNVTEWTSTPNPNADTYMFVRGHNWSDFDPENMWIEPYSGSISSDDHSPYIGFRCALSVNSTNAP
jgi:formylglycine-generating enzyme required for sulfatase activity